jgi:hypothetical protein
MNPEITQFDNFVFPVNKIDRENSEKFVSQDRFEVNQMRIQKL